LVLFYIFLNSFLKNEKIKFVLKNEEIKKIEDDFIKERFEYLIKNVEILSREIFYKEVSIFLRNLIFRKFKNNSVFFMTFEEIKKTFKNEYNEILKEVYFIEFDEKKEDSFKVRKEILEKIKF